MNTSIFKGYTILLFLWLSSSLCLSAQNAPTFNSDPKPAGKKWVKVANMSDEFNNGTFFDNAKWHKNPRENGWTWIGRFPGLFEEESVYVSGGNLRCTVLKYPTPKVVNGRRWLYRGGIIRSRNAAGVGHYFECRMKANATEMSSTFWLKPRITCGQNLELDIQECVGKTGPQTQPYAKGWDQIMHSNMFNFKTNCGPNSTAQKQGAVKTPAKNHSRYFVYGCYVESPTKAHFYLDGQYQYSITPPAQYNVDMFITMAMETYDWNPVPSGGGMVRDGDWNQRTTQYDWVRTWKLVNNTTGGGGGGNSTYVHLQNRATDKFIRPQANTENGVIAQAPNTYIGDWTQWQVVNVDGQYFHLKNKATGKYMRPQANQDYTTIIQSSTANNSQWQTQWKRVPTSDGYFYLENRWTGRYMRPTGNDDLSGDTGTNFVVQGVPKSLAWHYTQWKFTNARGAKEEIAASEATFDMYPSPATDVLNLRAGDANYTVRIYDLGGRLVKSTSVSENTVETVAIDNLPSGIYVVEYHSGQETKTFHKKLVIE